MKHSVRTEGLKPVNARGTMTVDAVPGRLRLGAGAGTGTSGELSLEAAVWSPARLRAVAERLGSRPGELYGLMRGRIPDWLREEGLLPDAGELAAWEGRLEAAASEGAPTAGQLVRLLESRPHLALALRGLPKRELLGGVFGAWAAAAPAAAEAGAGSKGSAAGGLAAELARLERRGPGDQAGEWLSEAAAEGMLHQPGPQFREVRSRPFPADPEVAPPSGAWAALLPGAPGVEEGLSRIVKAVAEAAAERAKRLPK